MISDAQLKKLGITREDVYAELTRRDGTLVIICLDARKFTIPPNGDPPTVDIITHAETEPRVRKPKRRR